MLEQDTEPVRSIRKAIEQRGPISFAEFMELALYGPRGFYERPPVGEGGHFVTSPHVHPVFGDLLGRGLRACWSEMAQPSPLTLVEVGAGDGTLARQLRAGLADVPKRYVAVERSPGAREALRSLDPPVRVLAGLESMDQGIDGCVVANELLDNLPFLWARRGRNGNLREVRVAVRAGRFVAVEERSLDLEAMLAAHRVPRRGEGPIPEGALHFVDRLARVLRWGYALLIDYEAGRGSEIQGYRGHRPVEDVLAAPGTSDITAGVDFSVLHERAEALGLRSFPTVSQRSALLSLGYEEWAERERRRQALAQDARSGREAILAWSGRNAAELLVDPGGLGRLKWWLVASGDLGPPSWYGDALRREEEQRGPIAPGWRSEAEIELERRARGLGPGPRSGIYRSTSPTTKNTLPMIAMRSGNSCPRSSSGSTEMFEKDAVRIFSRYGDFPPLPIT